MSILAIEVGFNKLLLSVDAVVNSSESVHCSIVKNVLIIIIMIMMMG